MRIRSFIQNNLLRVQINEVDLTEHSTFARNSAMLIAALDV